MKKKIEIMGKNWKKYGLFWKEFPLDQIFPLSSNRKGRAFGKV